MSGFSGASGGGSFTGVGRGSEGMRNRKSVFITGLHTMMAQKSSLSHPRTYIGRNPENIRSANCRPESLHPGHRKCAIPGATWTPREGPHAGDGIAIDCSGQREIVPAGRSRDHVHAKLAGHIAIEVPAERERAAFCLTTHETCGVGRETKVADAKRAVRAFRNRGVESKHLSAVGIG